MEIMNHNASFREFVYRVELTPEEIRQELERQKFYSGARYRFDRLGAMITFSTELPMGQPDITYGLSITRHQGYSLLKVVQLDWLREKNRFAGIQNDFWGKMVGAEPVDYIRNS